MATSAVRFGASVDQIRIKLTIETALTVTAGRNQQIIKIWVPFSPKLVLYTLEFTLKAVWKKVILREQKTYLRGH